MRRFVPDFKTLTGNAKVSLGVKRYPQQSDTTTTLSPFTVTSSTLKKDTRARGRFVNVKIENDSSGEEWRFGTLRLDIQGDGRIMTKINIRIPEPKTEYDVSNQKQINRALTLMKDQLNSTFLDEVKQEQERFSWFIGG